MTPLEAAALVALLVAPFHLALQRYVARLADASHVRKEGVVIVCLRALDGHAPSIGSYMGHEIWRTVTFLGMVYRFERVAPASYATRIAPRELYLEPGLIYVTD
jgi:hypothetical protein